MYSIDILRVKLDMGWEGSTTQTYQAGCSDCLYEFRQIVCNWNFDSFINFLQLIGFDNHQSVLTAVCGTHFFDTGYSTGNGRVNWRADESFSVAQELTYFHVVSLLH